MYIYMYIYISLESKNISDNIHMYTYTYTSSTYRGLSWALACFKHPEPEVSFEAGQTAGWRLTRIYGSEAERAQPTTEI